MLTKMTTNNMDVVINCNFHEQKEKKGKKIQQLTAGFHLNNMQSKPAERADM